MRHIDTLKAYTDLLEGGVGDKLARRQVKFIDESLSMSLKDFVTNKVLYVLSSLFVIVWLVVSAELYQITKNIELIQDQISEVKKDIHKLSEKHEETQQMIKE